MNPGTSKPPIKTLPLSRSLSLSLVNLQLYSCRKLLQMRLKMNPGTSKPPIKSTVKALPKSKLLQFLLKLLQKLLQFLLKFFVDNKKKEQSKSKKFFFTKLRL
jgi:hypothetical protein